MHKQAATSGKAESAAAKHRSMPTIGVDVPAAIATCKPMAARREHDDSEGEAVCAQMPLLTGGLTWAFNHRAWGGRIN